MINDKYMDLIEDEHKIAYLLYKQGKMASDYGSHQPVLIHLLNTIKEGTVLEYGMGDFSTPICHVICGLQGRGLLSLETNYAWYLKYKKYADKDHVIDLIDNDRLAKGIYTTITGSFHYSIAFIDGAFGPTRQPLIMLLKKNVDYFIVHDTEGPALGRKHDGYHYDFSSFKHVFHFLGNPPTSVLSDLDEINEDILKVFEL